MQKILIIQNSNSVVHMTYKKSFQQIGKELNVEIITKSCEDIWYELQTNTFDKEIKKVWMITKDEFLAKQLELNHIKVFNSSKSIELCNNKGLQALYLKKYLPKLYYICPYTNNIKELDKKKIEQSIEKYPCILKKCFGSRGLGVYKINNKRELFKTINKLKTTLWFIQEYIDTSDNKYQAISYRVFIVNNKVKAIMKNCSKDDYRTQTIHGGEHYKIDLPKEAKEIALKVVKIIKNYFAGVDIFQDNITKKWYISEINTSGGLQILSRLYKTELSKEILKFIKGIK